ncbi:MAG: hypothetical protein IJD94_01320 [Clostridia bacterium]|nr:hypothetical protein [Clostridia bacterium]
MNAATAFEHRKEALEAQLMQAAGIDEAIAACQMALEQTACELAQDEQDEHARQRQQAVMALARRAPALLRAVCARGEMIVEKTEQPAEQKEKIRKAALAAGAFLLSALAVYEVIDGKAAFAALQLAGGALLAWSLRGGGKPAAGVGYAARGIPMIDPKTAVRMLGELLKGADVCVSDLVLLEQDAGMARLSGTADEAMIDLLVSLMEAKESGRDALAMRSLTQAEQYLRMLGMELIRYSEAHAGMFDILPTMGEARTIRPAVMKDGKLVRRGTAACPMERSARA